MDQVGWFVATSEQRIVPPEAAPPDPPPPNPAIDPVNDPAVPAPIPASLRRSKVDWQLIKLQHNNHHNQHAGRLLSFHLLRSPPPAGKRNANKQICRTDTAAPRYEGLQVHWHLCDHRVQGQLTQAPGQQPTSIPEARHAKQTYCNSVLQTTQLQRQSNVSQVTRHHQPTRHHSH